MTIEYLVQYIDNLFNNMMTRPGMYAGSMPESKSSLENQVYLLLQLRSVILNKDPAPTLRAFRMNAAKYVKKLNLPSFGAGPITATCNSELDVILVLRSAWEDTIRA